MGSRDVSMSYVEEAADELLDFALGFTVVTLSERDVENDDTSFVGRELEGKYKLLSCIASGGVGEVYEAAVLAGGPHVAIKIMRHEAVAQPDLIRRFRREARAASLLAHANVVKVLELAEDPKAGLFFIVMELLEGDTVGTWLQQLEAPPALQDVRTIMLSLLDAFEAAHAAGIVHRDLKPDNLSLRSGPHGDWTVKVLDFGLARVPDPEDQGTTLTRPDSMGGTPDYMSPEQCMSLRVGPSADLYAMGCVLTELLQLRAPFEGGAVSEIMARQMFTPPPPLKRPSDAPRVPASLERLRLDLLAKKPEDRPQDVAEVRRRLLEAFEDSAPPSPTQDQPTVQAREEVPEGAVQPQSPIAARTTLAEKVMSLLRGRKAE
jgi:eukaryotic-like serine/threonine-protein kinase